MGLTLDNYPCWSQNADPDPDGQADPFASTDCGWEACSIVIRGRTGEYTAEGTLRRESGTHDDHGATIAGDLVTCLHRHGVMAVGLQVPFDTLRFSVKQAITKGVPVILLGRFVDPAVLHWIVAIGFGNDHLIYVDPWDGRMKCLRWGAVESLYAGALVRVASRDK